MHDLTTYVAKTTMNLKDKNTCLSCVQTIWRDKAILVVYNNLTNKITDTLFDPILQTNDIEILEELVSEFLLNTVDK